MRKGSPEIRPVGRPRRPSSSSPHCYSVAKLTELRTAQSNPRRLVTDPTVRGSFDALLKLLASQIRELADRIVQLIDSDPLWQKLDAAFRTIKGVADRTVARLIAELPEIGTLSNKAAAKLAGLAPIARDSGKLVGKRPVRGGRRGIRSILFVVADVVRRYDHDFTDCHRRLTEAGKPKKLIRVALVASCSSASTPKPARPVANLPIPLDK